MPLTIAGRRVITSGILIAQAGEEIYIDEGGGCTLTIRLNGDAEVHPAGHKGSSETDLLLILPAQRPLTGDINAGFGQSGFDVRCRAVWHNDIDMTISYLVLEEAR